MDEKLYNEFGQAIVDAIETAKERGLDAGLIAALLVDKAYDITFDVSAKPELGFKMIIGILNEKIEEMTHDPERN